MKKLVIAFLLLISSIPGLCQSEALGKWITVDDKTSVRKSVVEFYERNGKYYAKVIKMLYRTPEERCSRCEGDRKDKLVLGMDIITDMKYRKSSKEFKGGIILNPESGKTYDGKIWVENGKLMVRGYLYWFYRTQTWVPYEEDSVSGG